MTLDVASGNILTGLLHQKCSVPSVSSQTEMTEAIVVEKLIASTRGAFATMCDLAVNINGEPRPGCAVHHFELSGVVGLVGPWRVTVAIGLPRDLAFHVVEKLTGARPATIDADVLDVVGELANIIVGTTKRELGDCGLAIELPKVIFGHGHRVTFGADMNLYVLPFRSEAGPFQIELGIDGLTVRGPTQGLTEL